MSDAPFPHRDTPAGPVRSSSPGTSIPAPSTTAGPLRTPSSTSPQTGAPQAPVQTGAGQGSTPVGGTRPATQAAPKATMADTLGKKSAKRAAGKQVRLRLVYVDFWSALKLSFLAAVAIAIATVVSFFLIHFALSTTGLIDTADEFVLLLTDGNISLASFLTLTSVMSFGAVVAILNLVVVTVLGAVVAGIYNMAVKITGGLLVGFMSN